MTIRTTGPRYSWRGLGPADIVRVASIELELLELELSGHRELLRQLYEILRVAALTPAQSRALLNEIHVRQTLCKRLNQTKYNRRRAILAWNAKRAGRNPVITSQAQLEATA